MQCKAKQRNTMQAHRARQRKAKQCKQAKQSKASKTSKARTIQTKAKENKPRDELSEIDGCYMHVLCEFEEVTYWPANLNGFEGIISRIFSGMSSSRNRRSNAMPALIF